MIQLSPLLVVLKRSAKLVALLMLVIVGLAGVKLTGGPLFAIPAVQAQAYQRVTAQPGNFLQLGSYLFVQLDNEGTLMALESVFLCPTGSYVDNDSCRLCTEGLDHCSSCTSATACHTCETGYHLENFECVPDCSVANCNSCDSPNHCAPTGCSSGYYTNTTTGSCDACISLDSNCTTCSDATTCDTCATGYYPTGSSCTACGDTLSHCSSCSDSSTCLTCEAGYHVAGGSCVPDCSVANCNSCDSPNHCSDAPDSCATGYYPSGGSCSSCSSITGCSECSDGSTCTTCRPGYTLENGNCTPTGNVNDCAVYSDPDICDSCNSGYYLDSNSCTNCNTITANCSSCSGATESATLTCDGCDSGYHFDSGSCVMDCSPTGGNCNTCSSPNYCSPTGCSSGYFSAGGLCTSCSSTLPHCNSCSDGTTCTSCETGYHVEGGVCVLDCNVANCDSCDSPNHCAPTGCSVGYTANPTTGVCEMNCSVANCASSSSCYGPDQCGTCNSGYYPNPANGQCNACSGLHSDCLTCTDASTCTACGGASYLNGSACESCATAMTGCTACANGSTCTSCSTGYNLVGDTCVPTGTDPNCNVYVSPNICSSTGCNGGYYNNTGTCASCTTGCSDCSSGSTCNVCNTGYYLDGNTCSSCSVMTGCAACTNGSTCTTCGTGYNLVAGECIPTGSVENCTVYSNPDQCSTCDTGYYLNTNACPACSDTLTTNCLSCTSAGHCTSCSAGTILQTGECHSCSEAVADCDTCDGTACTSCTTGNYLDATGACPSCSSVMTGCSECSDSDTCTTCSDGYNLVAGECIPTGSVPNCATYSAPEQCSVCGVGYTLDDDACMMNCSPLGGNCNTCDSPDHCSPTGCISGYFSDNGTCSACDTSIPGCTACSSGATCTSCGTGYTLDGATCRATPAAPANLTVPATIYNAQTIAITWDLATNATGYILERSCNSGAWNQIYQGASPSATNNLADCDAPVQYRVKAFNTLATIASSHTTTNPQNYAACSGNCTQCADASACICTNNTTPVYAGLTMQEFTPAQCAAVTTPEATCYSAVGTFTDARDGKLYEVRKFADGNCWMVDNLAYGGAIASASADLCAGKTTFDGDGATIPSNAFGAGTYGDCRDNPDDPTYGYLYNWQAAMQHASAYYNSDYQPPEPTQGICPTGWHLPSGGNTSSEFSLLDQANGGTGAEREDCTDAACNFFRPGYNFKGVYAGVSSNAGALVNQSSYAYWWSSTQYSNYGSYNLYVDSSLLYPGDNSNNKYNGFSIRCLKNTVECSANCLSCNSVTTCNACTEGYAVSGGTCVPTGNVENCATYSAPNICSACTTGYYLAGDTCVAFTPTADCSTAIGTMQTFTAADCATYTTPSQTNYTAIGCLVDERDSKVYEVRKFADGKCWMVDDLRYGGAADACVNKTTFSGNGSFDPTNRFGAGTYGDCRNTPGSSTYGYLYSWQAAMQHESAYYNTAYIGPTTSVQGICPAGWHIPSGNTSGEFLTLRAVAGSPSVNGFWIGGNFKGVDSGYCVDGGGVYNQGSRVMYWTSTQRHASSIYIFDITDTYAENNSLPQNHGFSVRCIKSDFECPINCDSCNSATTCDRCATGYTFSGGACIPTGTVPNCSTYSAPEVCSACEGGYNLEGDSCEPTGDVANCSTYSEPGVCSACESGHYPSDIGDSCTAFNSDTNCPTAIGTMQTFTAADCATYAKPAALGYTAIGCLVDERDGKAYEVRKFADGNCWMVDNLKYGGAIDACASKTTWNGASNLSGAAWGYGDCHNNPGSPTYGYLYNWQAAMQHPTAALRGEYAGLAINAQGICPTGWHIPTGNTTGEFATLDKANGGTGTNSDYCLTAACNFFRPSYNFKGAYAGVFYNDRGRLDGQGNNMSLWSSTVDLTYMGNMSSRLLWSGPNIFYPNSTNYRSDGMSVRCIKNSFDCLANCDSCNSATTCNQCATGYAFSGGACIPTGTVPNCTTYSAPNVCSTCATGYTLDEDNNVCVADCNPTGGNCSTCDTPDHCSPTGCVSGYFNDSGVCSECSSAMPGCTACSSSSVCTSCDDGYVLDGATCLPIPEAPTNLTIPTTIYNAATITISWDATSAATGYTLERSCNGSAWNQIYQGATPSATNDLTGCTAPVQYRAKAYHAIITNASDFTTSNSQSYTACSANCLSCSDANTCTVCNSGYGVVNGKCVSCDSPAGIIGTMQDFTAAQCSALATPTGTNYTPAGCLVDARDSKVYEVRKFADGKCWMVDNLKYGGAIDACASKTTFSGNGSYAPTNLFGTGTYGDCRNNPGNALYGYIYNWQAAMQLASAYYGNSYQPAQPTQGICPAGWHVPSGGPTGEFVALDKANGGTGVNRQDNTASSNFFRPGYSFKGICAGDHSQGNQGWHGNWWSSTQTDAHNNLGMHIAPNASIIDVSYNVGKRGGGSVRCIKSNFECPVNCDSCSSATNCIKCKDNYVNNGGLCIPTGAVAHCTAYSAPEICSACENGYYPSNTSDSCVAFNSTVNCPTAVGTMQTFTTADCAAYTTPSGTNYAAVGCLVDERDSKGYEIRKFADGNCWMVDNLMYGGGSDGSGDYCSGKSTLRSADSVANVVATATNGLNPTDGSRNTLVGDCRDPRISGTAPCIANSTECGYYYNWPAAIQSTSGHRNISYQPVHPTQGICPTGWHVPSGGLTGEFQALHVIAGSPMTDFWHGGNWKGVGSGQGLEGGLPEWQGHYGFHWSITQYSATYAYYMVYSNSRSQVQPADSAAFDKARMATVRCIKD